MLLGILSDTHDQWEVTARAIAKLCEKGAQAIAHCGDLTDSRIVEICSILPFYFVYGNHDADNVPELQQAARDQGAVCLEWGGEISLAGKTIAIAHGHMFSDIRGVMAGNPDYLLTGHSHIAGQWQQDTTRRINPGALYQAEALSVALLDLKTGEVQFPAMEEPPGSG